MSFQTENKLECLSLTSIKGRSNLHKAIQRSKAIIKIETLHKYQSLHLLMENRLGRLDNQTRFVI